MSRGKKIWATVAEVLAMLARYTGGQVIIAVALSVLYFITFYLLSVPGWYVLAPLCGLFHLIPIVGVVLGAAVPLLVLAMSGASWKHIGIVLLVFAFANILETFVFNPLIHGKRLRLHPAAVFFVAIAGGMFFGFFGALFAVPLLAAAAIIWRRHRSATSQPAPPTRQP
jgi:predicted PurR-regulated permease PerM